MSIKYHYRPEELLKGVSPKEAGLEYISCKRIELDSNTPSLIVQTGNQEVVFVVTAGKVNYDFNEKAGTAIFKDMVYVPWKSRITLSTPRKTVVMQVGALSDRNTDFAHIAFSEVAKDPNRHKVYGFGETNCLRHVYTFLGDDFNAARLMVGICQGSIGGWTSWPPHEHAEQREEIYVYFDMGKEFGVQLVYENLENPLYVGIVWDGDMVSIPRGYHPNVGCPAGRICYIYAMAARKAGERKFLDLHIQKDFGSKFE